MQHHQTIHFAKMHGLGNDFVVINAIQQLFHVDEALVTTLANRHTGVGFDQLLMIEPSSHADFFCRIYNSDGSEAEQCGNGLRCISRFIHEKKLFPQTSFTIETKAGVYPVKINDYDHITVTMGTPQIHETLINLPVENSAIPLCVLNFGNPHAILKVSSLDTTSIGDLGAIISTHSYFPQGTNVGFMEILAPHHIRLRTFERGAGQTYACGSNACAAAMAGIVNGWLENKVTVDFQLGSLLIEWDSQQAILHMTGPATHVFDGVA